MGTTKTFTKITMSSTNQNDETNRNGPSDSNAGRGKLKYVVDMSRRKENKIMLET